MQCCSSQKAWLLTASYWLPSALPGDQVTGHPAPGPVPAPCHSIALGHVVLTEPVTGWGLSFHHVTWHAQPIQEELAPPVCPLPSGQPREAKGTLLALWHSVHLQILCLAVCPVLGHANQHSQRCGHGQAWAPSGGRSAWLCAAYTLQPPSTLPLHPPSPSHQAHRVTMSWWASLVTPGQRGQ